MANYWIILLYIVGIVLIDEVTSEVNHKRHNNSFPLKLTLINSSGFNRYPWWQSVTTERSPANFFTYPIGSFGWNNAVETTTITSTTHSPHKSHRSGHHHKHHIGRHVCPEKRLFPISALRTRDIEGGRMIYEDHYRDVHRHHRTDYVLQNCCPGWERIHINSSGCNKPVCKMGCKNGGKCVKPETCSCKNGFNGQFCELDVNECKEEKPCDQMCFNTEGSYYCTCRDGFILQSDKQSCKKIDDAGTALEAREMDVNDVDYDEINARLMKLEKLTSQTELMEKRLRQILEKVDLMKSRLDHLDSRHYEINYFREKLKTYDMQSKKIENMINLWYKCQRNPHLYCPS
ncbi:latent-transforming growth factor beta-binding protein 4 [Sergentomyia squamirostris]